LEFTREQLRELTKDQLIDIIFEFDKRLKEQSKRITELERNAARRSASPFSKNKGKKLKKKPGRRAGQGTFTRREEPEPGPTDMVETTEVTLEEDQRNCLDCGEPLETKVEVATTIDVPTQPQRNIQRFNVEVGVCPQCGRQERASHPDLPRDQFGATAHRIGENVLAWAFALHYASGLTLRKAAAAIAMLTGIKLTQSALTQRAKQLCKSGATFDVIYRELREEVRQSPVVNTDDTGWRTEGRASYLMGFFTPSTAVYQVRDFHRRQEVIEVIGLCFEGVLGTDRGPSYEAEEFDEVLQQKCLSHLIKNLSEVEKTKRGWARRFTRELKETLRESLELWHAHQEGRLGWRSYRKKGQEIREKLDHQLRERVLSDTDNQRMLDGIRLQNDRNRVLLFLDIPEVEPTNNRAERGLRPAVIARKVSQCSKNATGAHLFEVMKSITETIKLRGHNVPETLAKLIPGDPMPLPPAGAES